MRRGACVIPYDGKRGLVWRIKYRDASGRQVQETLGRADEGWTEKKAHAELEARLTDVRREGLRKPTATTVQSFAEAWLGTYPDAKGLKKSTRGGYRTIVNKHFYGSPISAVPLGALTGMHVEAYVAEKRRQGLGPRTINRHLNLLHKMLTTAVKQKLVRSNAVEVERLKEPRLRWAILGPDEVARVEQAFRELIEEGEGEERAWREQARCIFLTVYGTGLRRGELLGLRWQHVQLADPEGAKLRVVETWVCAQVETPKSETSERTIALGPRIADELFEHRARTSYAGDEERVFCSPTKGTPFDVARYSVTFNAALAKAKIEKRVRPFHDGRHSAITNAAAAGNAPAALQARAGHSNFKTTQLYIDLAGVTFREAAEQAERRLFGYKKEVQTADLKVERS